MCYDLRMGIVLPGIVRLSIDKVALGSVRSDDWIADFAFIFSMTDIAFCIDWVKENILVTIPLIFQVAIHTHKQPP